MSSTEFYTLNCRGILLSLEEPVLMGILNVTPDSFSDGGKFLDPQAALDQTGLMLEAGARIIDIGGYSSRPGADDISEEEEQSRILPVIEAIRSRFPEAILSVDTFRSGVAKSALDAGAHIINDISGGDLDDAMFELLAGYGNVPYIMMHMKGTPQNMQQLARYDSVVDAVWQSFVGKLEKARQAGVSEIVLDPGFGFGKTIAHNYQLLEEFHQFSRLGCPVLAGVSRKSFIYKVTGNEPADADMHSQVIQDHCLRKGANILRVHNVPAAARTIRLFQRMRTDGIV